MFRRGTKKKTSGKRRRRKIKLARLAAAGALVAWLFNQKRKEGESEGVWKDISGDGPSH